MNCMQAELNSWLPFFLVFMTILPLPWVHLSEGSAFSIVSAVPFLESCSFLPRQLWAFAEHLWVMGKAGLMVKVYMGLLTISHLLQVLFSQSLMIDKYNSAGLSAT